MDSQNKPKERLVKVNIVTSVDGQDRWESLLINGELVAGRKPWLGHCSVALWLVPEDKLIRAIKEQQ